MQSKGVNLAGGMEVPSKGKVDPGHMDLGAQSSDVVDF